MIAIHLFLELYFNCDISFSELAEQPQHTPLDQDYNVLEHERDTSMRRSNKNVSIEFCRVLTGEAFYSHKFSTPVFRAMVLSIPLFLGIVPYGKNK